MTHVLLVTLLAFDARAVNGADDSPVLAPGAPVARPMYNVPLSTAAPAAKQQVYQLPIDTVAPPMPVPTPEPRRNDDSSSPSSDASNPMQAFAPMLQGMAGGNGGGGGNGSDRAAGSGDSGGYQPASTGSSSALDMKGSAGEKNGQAMNTVNGCGNGAGKFQMIYGTGNPPTECKPGSDGSLKMSETLSSFMDRNLNRCVSTATGKNTTGGKLFHAGVIGDSRHQQTGSLHNLGLAIDINAIQVEGTTYLYKNKDPNTSLFFQKFRQCWGEAAQKERLGCLQNGRSGTAPGTVGEEDSDHKNHLHVSVPLCPSDAKAKGLYMAWLGQLLWPSALAAEPVVQRRTIKLGGRGVAELSIRDQHGEPVDADHRFTVRVRCDGERVARTLLADEGGCDFVSFALKAGQLELRYLTSEMQGGELVCRKLAITSLKTGCPPSR